MIFPGGENGISLQKDIKLRFEIHQSWATWERLVGRSPISYLFETRTTILFEIAATNIDSTSYTEHKEPRNFWKFWKWRKTRFLEMKFYFDGFLIHRWRDGLIGFKIVYMLHLSHFILLIIFIMIHSLVIMTHYDSWVLIYDSSWFSTCKFSVFFPIHDDSFNVSHNDDS